MSALYICSPAPGAGKTTLAIGLAQHLAAEGLAVGYLKPVGRGVPDPDASFARQALRLRLPLEMISPVDLDQLPADAAQRIRAAYEVAARARDVVVLDGIETDETGLTGPAVAEMLDAKALVVAAYQSEGLADLIAQAAWPYGNRVIGAVIAAVPETALSAVSRKVQPEIEAAGVPYLGSLPVSRTLMSLTVAELADALGGEVLCAKEWTDKPVESVMLATISDTTAQWYFRRQNAKAVIAKGNRPDAHISALETETSCLIVTGGQDPQPHVLGLAADLEVTIVKVAEDTLAVLDRMTDLLPTVRFRQRHKLPAIADLLGTHFDFAALRRGLDLRQEATR